MQTLSSTTSSSATAASSSVTSHAMKLLEPDRELKVGLYFPLLDAWRGL